MTIQEMNTKQLILEIVDDEDSDIELGATVWNPRLTNELNDFAKPSQTPQEVERRIQNMNQILEVHTFETVVDDQFIRGSDIYSSEVQDKEDVYALLDNIFKSVRLLRFKYGDLEREGYLTELSFEERAQDDNSIFRIEFNFLVGRPMSGGS